MSVEASMNDIYVCMLEKCKKDQKKKSQFCSEDLSESMIKCMYCRLHV